VTNNYTEILQIKDSEKLKSWIAICPNVNAFYDLEEAKELLVRECKRHIKETEVRKKHLENIVENIDEIEIKEYKHSGNKS